LTERETRHGAPPAFACQTQRALVLKQSRCPVHGGAMRLRQSERSSGHRARGPLRQRPVLQSVL